MALSLFLAAAAIGVTDNPCPIPLPMPAELEAWRTTVYAAKGHNVQPPPIAAATAYRDAYNEARKNDWPDLCHYHADNARLKALPQAVRDVVFMGDSITEGWAAGNPLFYRDGRINRGVSGQTTQQMLLRFPQDVIALVHIMGGTNDVAGNTGPTTLDAIEGNIAAMVVLAKAAGIRVVLASTPPAGFFKWAPAMQPAPVIAALNERLRRLAARERISFLDYGAVLATPGGALRPEYTFDGTHLNAAGYAAMEPSLRKVLTSVR